MSKPAAMPLFGDAYLADTTHLTTEEHGAYLLLMIAAWRQEDCGLPMDDKKLARIAGLSTKKWTSIRDTIFEFWKVDNGRIYQPRLTKEHTYVCQKSQANRKSAEARWNKQPIDNKQTDECERISEGNAPPPPPTKDNKPKGSLSKRTRDFPKPDGVEQSIWNDYLEIRKAKRAPMSDTALAAIIREATKAGWTLNNALAECVARGWQSFKAEWVNRNGTGNNQNGPGGEPFSHNPMVQAIAAARAERSSGEPQFFERDADSWP